MRLEWQMRGHFRTTRCLGLLSDQITSAGVFFFFLFYSLTFGDDHALRGKEGTRVCE